MSMIEVDPKLFIKCRLCLDETGQYQIVPKVQMQIKYCFDIDVEPFDGLPQLVCKKCESILSQYAGIKQIFQEKQSNLKSKLNADVHSDSIQQDELPEVQLEAQPQQNHQPEKQEHEQEQELQQQQDTVSSTQTEVEHKNEPIENKKPDKTKSANIKEEEVRNFPIEKEERKVNESKHKSKSSKKTKNAWHDVSYQSYFVCRFCAKTYKSKKAVVHHLRKRCNMYAKYSNVLKSFCLVSLPKICSKPNLTGSTDNVVYNKNKIINSSKAEYYVLHTINSNKRDNSVSSDEDFIVDNKKRKRQRLDSRSSNETTIIENNTTKSIVSDDEESTWKKADTDNTNNVFDIECVNIEDSDSASTKSNLKAKDVDPDPCNPIPGNDQDQNLDQKPNVINDKMISNIINMCSTKYLNRFNGSKLGSYFRDKEVSSLKHKVLSLGRKVIHNKGINSTGLLRYMEHKDLEVVWKPKMESNVIISTRLKESNDNENSNLNWDDVPSCGNKSQRTQDFIDIYEKLLKLKSGSKGNDIDYNELHNEKLNEKPKVSATLKSNKTAKPRDILVIEDSINLEPSSSTNSNNGPAHKNSEPSCSTNSIICPPHHDSSESKLENGVSIVRNIVDSEKHNSKKLLNANPVANPKQLYKKTNISELATLVKTVAVASDSDTQINNEDLLVEKNNDLHNMPIITSTVSLAQTANEQANVQANNEPTGEQVAIAKPSTLPKIKVKPASELMSERALNQHNSTHNIITSSNWTAADDNNSTNVHSPSVVLQNNNANVVYVTSPPVFNSAVSVSPQNIYFYPKFEAVDSDLKNTITGFNPNAGNVQVILQAGSSVGSVNREYIKLHTVELPNTKTDAPFQYFQKLLLHHNIHLLDSVAMISSAMKCLTKFKVVFEQEANTPVKLCLCLFCERNVFCIKAKDHLFKDLDIAKFSANWQWEILKVFKGDVVTKLLETSKKFGGDIFTSTTYFISLLKSIVFSKDN